MKAALAQSESESHAMLGDYLDKKSSMGRIFGK